MSLTVTIYHNPACDTSRNTLAVIRQSGEEPHVIEYLKTTPAREELIKLIELQVSRRANSYARRARPMPSSAGAIHPSPTLAPMQVSGGSQSFNAVNHMRIFGRWMRMVTIPNQSSVPKAFLEFDEAGRMKPSSCYSRAVDVCEEVVKFTWLVRGHSAYLTDRYSERIESAAELPSRVNQRAI